MPAQLRAEGSLRAAQADATTRVDAAPADSYDTRRVASPAELAFGLDYDLSAARIEGVTREYNLTEFGAATPNGVLRHSVLAQPTAVGPIRLETTLTHDTPWGARALRTGDSITRAGAWGRPVRFGGVQASTQFSAPSEFVAMPLAGATGNAALPSTVDMLIDSATRMSQVDGTGAFSLSGLPVLNANGDLSLVVHDALGREQRVVQPFYAPPSLLGPGASDYSIETGALREDFGLLSDRYGDRFAAGTFRWGAMAGLTVEARAEMLARQNSTGVGVAWRIADLGVLSVAAATSRSEVGEGALSVVGFDRRSSELSFGGRVQRADKRFARLGSETDAVGAGRMAQFFVGTGPFAVNYVDMTPGEDELGVSDTRDGLAERLRLLGTSYSFAVPFGSLSLTALRSMSTHGGYAVSALLSVPLDRRPGTARPWTSATAGGATPYLQ